MAPLGPDPESRTRVPGYDPQRDLSFANRFGGVCQGLADVVGLEVGIVAQDFPIGPTGWSNASAMTLRVLVSFGR